MRASRVFRMIFRIFILVLTTSVTLVTFLGAYSAMLILSPPPAENISVDMDNADFNFKANITTGVVTDFNFTLPINLNNVGYFDLNNLEAKMELAVRYEHINLTIPGQNDLVMVKFFEVEQFLGSILKGQTKNLTLFGDLNDFDSAIFPDLLTEVNWNRIPEPDIEFFLNFTVNLEYSLGLHQLAFGMYNQPTGVLSFP